MNTIVIKLSGELFKNNSPDLISNIVKQIKKLKKDYNIAIVLGAGNILRGNEHQKKIGIKATTAHTAGMIATIINGLIIQDFLEKEKVDAQLFSAINCPEVACVIKQTTIDNALSQNKCLIFVGGTGNPFFTTDTNAVLRTLQIGATEMWKGTKVEGIYSTDPLKNKKAKLYKQISYDEVINQNLKIMDLTAIKLAQENKIKIKVFNIFEKDALIKASKNKTFGSYIS
ncbi:UMP kinase [Candidatus Dependentiae bacterium]|nr:UMP kinase [Candidatus Dependentiae bacterium]